MSRLISQAPPQCLPLAPLAAHRSSTPRTGSATKCAHGQTAAITAPSPASAKTPNPHRPTPARRGFVPPRLSYAFGARNSQGSQSVSFSTFGSQTRRSAHTGRCLRVGSLMGLPFDGSATVAVEVGGGSRQEPAPSRPSQPCGRALVVEVVLRLWQPSTALSLRLRSPPQCGRTSGTKKKVRPRTK